MAKGKVKIDPDVEDVLRSAKIDGCQLKITWQLERKLYERTNKVLVALGGKWKAGKTQAHIFPKPVSEVLQESLDNGFAVDEKKALCQFFTPPDIASRMVGLLDLEPGMTILEPSAGTGNLLKAVFDKFRSDMSSTTAIEINPALAEDLRVGFPAATIRCADFLECIDERGFDRIIMNPPFDSGIDIKHIRHALSMLKPGGRLVALCANGPGQRKAFMEEADEWEDLSAGSFKEAGTMVNVAMMVLEKQDDRDPEIILREMWDRKGVPKEKQEEIIADATAKAQPGAMVGPFRIPDKISTAETESMHTMERDQIFPNPLQPRKYFDQAKLEELARSIQMNGLLEPIIVVPRDDKYMIIAGERRWRACGIAGLKKVPVRIMQADDQTVAELSLLENLQREDLSIVEEARAYQGLLDMGSSQEDIAAKMGMKQSWRIQERLNILKLTPTFQDYTMKGILSPSQAQELSRLPKPEQSIVFDKIAAGKLNTYNKLRSMVNAILFAQEQSSFLPEPTQEERDTFNKYDRLMERIISMLNQSFDKDDLSVLSKLLSSSAAQNIDRIDLIIAHLNKIKRSLLQADSQREVMERTAIAA